MPRSRRKRSGSNREVIADAATERSLKTLKMRITVENTVPRSFSGRWSIGGEHGHRALRVGVAAGLADATAAAAAPSACRGRSRGSSRARRGWCCRTRPRRTAAARSAACRTPPSAPSRCRRARHPAAARRTATPPPSTRRRAPHIPPAATSSPCRRAPPTSPVGSYTETGPSDRRCAAVRSTSSLFVEVTIAAPCHSRRLGTTSPDVLPLRVGPITSTDVSGWVAMRWAPRRPSTSEPARGAADLQRAQVAPCRPARGALQAPRHQQPGGADAGDRRRPRRPGRRRPAAPRAPRRHHDERDEQPDVRRRRGADEVPPHDGVAVGAVHGHQAHRVDEVERRHRPGVRPDTTAAPVSSDQGSSHAISARSRAAPGRPAASAGAAPLRRSRPRTLCVARRTAEGQRLGPAAARPRDNDAPGPRSSVG